MWAIVDGIGIIVEMRRNYIIQIIESSARWTDPGSCPGFVVDNYLLAS
jgi:hypothetical protein